MLGGVRRKIRSGHSGDAVRILAEIAVLEEKIRASVGLAESLFGFFKDIEADDAGAAYNRREIWLGERFRSGEKWCAVLERGVALQKGLAGLIERGRSLVRLLEEAQEDYADAIADTTSLLMRLAGQIQTLEMVLDADEDKYVYYMVFDRRRKVMAEKLCAALLDVADVLAEQFLPSAKSAVFTSATLAIGDDFSHFAERVGLDRGTCGGYVETQLKSGYDMEEQMTVFVSKDMPMPDEPGYLQALSGLLVDIHIAMGGSVLTLFTNRRQMESLHEEIASRLQPHGIPLLVQKKARRRSA